MEGIKINRNYQVKDIPIHLISDINYAFMDLKLNSDGHYVPVLSDPWADVDKTFGDNDKVPGQCFNINRQREWEFW